MSPFDRTAAEETVRREWLDAAAVLERFPDAPDDARAELARLGDALIAHEFGERPAEVLTVAELDARTRAEEAREFFAGFGDAHGNPEAGRRGRLLAGDVVDLTNALRTERSARLAIQADRDRVRGLLTKRAAR